MWTGSYRLWLPDRPLVELVRATEPMKDGDMASGPRTLAIDIGGSGLKMIVLGPAGEPLNERHRERTPGLPTPAEILPILERMVAAQPAFDRVAAGFPGVVSNGVTLTAVNLHPDWVGFDFATALESMTGAPARLANDADVQGLAVIDGVGVELVLTLGTGLGSGLYVDCKLVPNLEIAHHVFRKGSTYEEMLGNAALERLGREKWTRRLEEAVGQLEATFNYQRLFIGGGNSGKAARASLPDNVGIVSNIAGLLGCIHLWESVEGMRW
ncbi:MAG: ROK family protein [Bryobacterales bacterium]|nr:ROK family protein [Bryobacterales bacterium]